MPKLTRARREYNCYQCKSIIEKGSMYSKKSMSIGSPGKETIENRGGTPTIIVHGFRFTERICSKCSEDLRWTMKLCLILSI